MSLQETVSAERLHIAFFGRRNVGKSSLLNAITGQEVSLTSAVKGTTTDPVKKAMELLPLGPVLLIDTAGLDDEGELGALRIQKSREVLAQTDVAVLVADATVGLTAWEEAWIADFQSRKLPYLVVYNKLDLQQEAQGEGLFVSSLTGENIPKLKEALANLATRTTPPKRLVLDLLHPQDTVLLVMPIDESAPKGRLILPQQQTLRELLDGHCKVLCCQDTEVAELLADLKQAPKLVITDSQVFEKVAKSVPPSVLLTSFSILFARYKGELPALLEGATRLSHLQNGDTVLISEACTHHRQCNDIGSVKLPKWIEEYTGVSLRFVFTSGGSFPEDLSPYALVVHCGGCMSTETEMKRRLALAKEQQIPMVNYGIAIAQMHGILSRSMQCFPAFRHLVP